MKGILTLMIMRASEPERSKKYHYCLQNFFYLVNRLQKSCRDLQCSVLIEVY